MKKRIIGTIVVSILLLGVIVSVVLLSSVPPVSKDALIHHLAVPKLYIEHGGMYEIPGLLFSYYPMNLELLYLIPLFMGNDIIPKYIHFLFALLTAWLLYGYLARRTERLSALLGALFFLSIPIIVKLSITAYVDLGLIFFTAASLLFLLRWLETDFRLRYLIGSALCCGLGMGVKYNGIITCLLLALFVPFLFSRYARGTRPGFFQSAGRGILFAGVAVLPFVPWMIRNFIWTGNPVFPQYDGLFHPHNPVTQGAADLFTIRSAVYGETWWKILLLPIRIFFQGQDGNPQYFDGVLNPVLLVLPVLAFLRISADDARLRAEKKILLAFSLLFFLFAVLTRDLRIRYIAPILPVLVILSVFGVRRLYGMISEPSSPVFKAAVKTAVVFCVLIGLGFNASYLIEQFQYVKPFDYLSGRMNRDEYIARYRLEYPALRYINENLPEDSLILFFFMGKRGYYCNRDYLLDMKDYRGTHSIFLEVVKKAEHPEEVLSGLREKGITHLLINHPLFDEWILEQTELHEFEMLRAFFKKHVELIFYENDHGLSRLRDVDEQTKQHEDGPGH